MNIEKYNRSVTLLCPTCGSTQFSPVSPADIESETHKCMACGRQITRDELIRENSENIDEHLDGIKQEIAKDSAAEIKKQLASAFKGNKFIKIK